MNTVRPGRPTRRRALGIIAQSGRRPSVSALLSQYVRLMPAERILYRVSFLASRIAAAQFRFIVSAERPVSPEVEEGPHIPVGVSLGLPGTGSCQKPATRSGVFLSTLHDWPAPRQRQDGRRGSRVLDGACGASACLSARGTNETTSRHVLPCREVEEDQVLVHFLEISLGSDGAGRPSHPAIMWYGCRQAREVRRRSCT